MPPIRASSALVAAGQALAAAEAALRDREGAAGADPAGLPVQLTIDGQVIPTAEARAALETSLAAAGAQASRPATRLETALDKVEPRLAQAEKLLDKSKLGRKALDVVKQRPETVKRRFDVEVKLGPHTFSVAVDVVDARASTWLHRTVLGVDVVAMTPFIPFLGLAVRGGASLVAFTAALVARGVGAAPVADSLQATARKQLILGGFEAAPIPGLSTGSALAAAIANGQNLVALRRSPTVAEVVSLGTPGAPT